MTTENKDYPGKEYQRLFNAIADSNNLPLESELQFIIKIVHEDFPKLNPGNIGKKEKYFIGPPALWNQLTGKYETPTNPTPNNSVEGKLEAIAFEDIVITIREMDNGNGVVDCNDLINSLENLKNTK